jgi:hypothetical protein
MEHVEVRPITKNKGFVPVKFCIWGAYAGNRSAKREKTVDNIGANVVILMCWSFSATYDGEATRRKTGSLYTFCFSAVLIFYSLFWRLFETDTQYTEDGDF